MKKVLSFLLLGVLCISLLAGCGAANGESGEAKTTLVVGLDDTFCPMGFHDESGELVGFDIDFANAVGEEMGMKIEFKPIDWDAKEMELSTGKIDCVWNGMSKTPEREETMSLSVPYLKNHIIIMTNQGVTVASKEDLKNLKIGTQVDSSALECMQADAIYPEIKANVTEYKSYDECIMDMQAGRLDCMVVDEVLGKYKNDKLGNIFGVSEVDFGEDLYVVGFSKDNTSLNDQVSAAMKALAKNGKAAELCQKWFGEDILAPDLNQ